jgi:hypothetical protein
MGRRRAGHAHPRRRDPYEAGIDTDFVFMNFVDARLDFRAAEDDLDVAVVGVKRGALTGGDGYDSLAVVGTP